MQPLIDDHRVRGCSEFIVNETVNKIGSEFIWLQIAIEPTNKEIPGFSISKERNMFVAERFLSNLSEGYGKYSISTDGGPSIYKLASFRNQIIILIPLMRKASQKELYNISEIELNALMTIFQCRKKGM